MAMCLVVFSALIALSSDADVQLSRVVAPPTTRRPAHDVFLLFQITAVNLLYACISATLAVNSAALATSINCFFVDRLLSPI